MSKSLTGVSVFGYLFQNTSCQNKLRSVTPSHRLSTKYISFLNLSLNIIFGLLSVVKLVAQGSCFIWFLYSPFKILAQFCCSEFINRNSSLGRCPHKT